MTEDTARHHDRVFPVLAALAAGTVGGACLIAPLVRSSNCGGNSAALTTCDCHVMMLQAWQDDHPGETFCIDKVGHELPDVLLNLPGADWLPSARFLARLDSVSMDSDGPRQIVIVCDRAYDNVPQRMFWRSPMAHAVGYSTGETGLISPSEFRQLDLRGFRDLRTKMPD